MHAWDLGSYREGETTFSQCVIGQIGYRWMNYCEEKYIGNDYASLASRSGHVCAKECLNMAPSLSLHSQKAELKDVAKL